MHLILLLISHLIRPNNIGWCKSDFYTGMYTVYVVMREKINNGINIIYPYS